MTNPEDIRFRRDLASATFRAQSGVFTRYGRHTSAQTLLDRAYAVEAAQRAEDVAELAVDEAFQVILELIEDD